MQSLTGVWKGFYEFGSGYLLPHFAGRVEIEIILESTNDSFIGKCKDFESDISVYMESDVEGFMEDRYFSFRKTYQDTFVIEDNGEITKEPNKESVVFYTGQYDAERDCIFGFWEYSAEGNGIEDDEKFVNHGGIWKCER